MILVVEDERTRRAALEERVEGDALERARSVVEARDLLASTNPSLLLLAVPLDDGAASLVRDVRGGRFGQPGLPIVAVTDGDRARAQALGVDETVETPVEESALEAAVDRAALVGRYKLAIDEFFDACLERARGSKPPEPPRATRRIADEVLAEINARDGQIPFERLIGGA